MGLEAVAVSADVCAPDEKKRPVTKKDEMQIDE